MHRSAVVPSAQIPWCPAGTLLPFRMPEIPDPSVPPRPPGQQGRQNSFLKNAVVLALGGISALYLVNPTAGFLEFIPDNIPFLGNLDEAGAMLLLINCLRHFGVDLSRIISFVKKTPDATGRQERDITPR